MIVDVDDFEERRRLKLVLLCFLNPLGELVSALLVSQLTQMRPAITGFYGVL